MSTKWRRRWRDFSDELPERLAVVAMPLIMIMCIAAGVLVR